MRFLCRGLHSGTGDSYSWILVNNNIAQALGKLGHEVYIQDLGKGRLPNFSHKVHVVGVNSGSTIPDNTIGVGYVTPLNLRKFPTSQRILLWGYETTILPPGWVNHIKQQATYVAPASSFSRNILISNGVPATRVSVVPHGIDLDAINPDIKGRPLHFIAPFRFVTIAIPHKRKRLDILLEAFSRAFTSRDNVALIIKTFVDKNPKTYTENVKTLLHRIPNLQGINAPRVQILTQYFTNIASLLNNCHCYVTTTGSECFGLPVLEAMACKKPVIATNYGGYTDFLNNDTGYLIDCKVHNASKGEQYFHYDETALIAEASVEHTVELLRYVHKHYSAAQAKAEKAYKVAITYTWENAASKIEQIAHRISARRKK